MNHSNPFRQLTAVLLKLPTSGDRSLDHAIYNAQRRDMALTLMAEHRANDPEGEPADLARLSCEDADALINALSESRYDDRNGTAEGA